MGGAASYIKAALSGLVGRSWRAVLWMSSTPSYRLTFAFTAAFPPSLPESAEMTVFSAVLLAVITYELGRLVRCHEDCVVREGMSAGE